MGKLIWANNQQYLIQKNVEQVVPFLRNFSLEQVNRVGRFQRTYEKFESTPLRSLDAFASLVGVQSIFVKDESYRFNLNAFKVLGGVYAIGQYAAKKLGRNIDELSFEQLKSLEVRELLGDLTFISTTDGNHGRGVAWAARELGLKARIYMPAGSAEERLQNIKNEGAYAEITTMNYDDTVRYTSQLAKENDWVVIQDTMWEGYEEIPVWIMQGYTTLVKEAALQLEKAPTHVFLQAGVGSFAGAVVAFLQQYYEQKITFVLVEPFVANCYYESFKAGAEQFVTVGGEMQTIMAGLACGEPNPLAWDLLKTYTKVSICCDEEVAATGMRILGNPLATDARIIAGESGAAPVGCFYELMTNEQYTELKDTLQLDENSRVLFINTEGDTDVENYRNIVWHGKYAKI
ncbi:diaminopropionate ammonia-lyase [Lysinibacillus agricola]|uniref:Diaminopropionate ammonia-lyase n=1 Tax=Lysinibacillus agricola TaxID=2590012 RepID=A0ABX7ASJ6_9BACI|nr:MULTISPECIES: diaminopropionate ammonia-lyase [Lysinibacillus]KOS64357.1 diaminopropionate ammonia-lyase [Lysinibacillus sp. FJAT-14222]QQP11883.1 diaminopropionate ammonia-lyase [Lysinibacillus agricola]